MADSLKSNLTRRTFLKGAGVATAAAVGLTIIVRSARAKSDTLKIGQWTHFVPWVAPISPGTIGWKWMLDSLSQGHRGSGDGRRVRPRAIVQIIMPISLAGILSVVIFAFTLTIIACLITSIPVAILYNLVLDRFISGVTMGAIK